MKRFTTTGFTTTGFTRMALRLRMAAGSLNDRAPRGPEAGSSLVEYVLLLALIAVVCILALTHVGGAVSTRLSTTATQVAAS